MVKQINKMNILHYPRLDTVLMIENAVQSAEDYPSKMQLWKSLPRKVQYQTFNLILDYLEESGKIMIQDGKIFWTYNPKLISKIKNNGLVIK
jgi:hypothetical protein